MGTLLINDPVQTDDLLSFDRISSGWSTGAAWDQAWATNPVTALAHQAQIDTTGANASVPSDPVLGLERIANNQPAPVLTPEQADERYGIPGELTFSNGDYANGVREEQAKLLNGWKREEITRRDILSRATPGFLPATARFGASFAASALDPINIATAFIPILPEARFLALAGEIGVTGARVARGALEGAVGQAAIEPLILLQARTEQSDYDMYDSLLNVTFGALLGAGLHAGGGFVKDRIVGAPDLRGEVRPEAPLTADTHHTALSGAVAAVAEDRPVMVADYVRAASRRDELLAGASLGRGGSPEPRLEPEAIGALRAPEAEAAARRVADVEARAREIDPATFSAYDRLAQEKATYSRWIQELGDGREKNPAIAELNKKIADAQDRVDGAPNQRKAKTYQKRLEDLQAERDAKLGKAMKGDSPDMARVRQKLVQADLGMRDLAEEVSAAKRQAEQDVPRPAADLSDVPGPLDQTYDPLRADTGQTFDQAWNQLKSQQAASPARPSEVATLASVDAKAKDYARPVTIDTESKALQEWSANDTDLVNQQRAAGNLDDADEALLKDGDAVEQTHLNRAKALEALGQCLIA